jgi:membrane protease subunit HflC
MSVSKTVVKATISIVVFASLLTLWNAVFIVRPDQFAIVTQFGEPKRVIGDDEEPGLYFMSPFVQAVRYLDRRVHGWDDTSRDTKTLELRTIDFTAFARWRIDPTHYEEGDSGPLRFYKAVRTHLRAAAVMDSIVTARIQAAVRQEHLASVVRDTGRTFDERAELDLKTLIHDYVECRPETNAAIAAILGEKRAQDATGQEGEPKRSKMVLAILSDANSKLKSEFGIEILDLHFKYLNYSPQVHAKMIEMIRADREKDIASYRKAGKACLGSIDQMKERRLGEILGERDRSVRTLGGQAQAAAIKTKASAFNADPEFFRFLETLNLYKRALANKSTLVLSTNSPIFSLLRDPSLMATVKKRKLKE